MKIVSTILALLAIFCYAADTGFNCNFDGGSNVKLIKVDYKTGTATMVGNAGYSEILALSGVSAAGTAHYTFLEPVGINRFNQIVIYKPKADKFDSFASYSAVLFKAYAFGFGPQGDELNVYTIKGHCSDFE